jgi:hypothetical protein
VRPHSPCRFLEKGKNDTEHENKLLLGRRVAMQVRIPNLVKDVVKVREAASHALVVLLLLLLRRLLCALCSYGAPRCGADVQLCGQAHRRGHRAMGRGSQSLIVTVTVNWRKSL